MKSVEAEEKYLREGEGMSANISKWFPKAASQKNKDKVFGKTKGIERELRILANKFTTNINFNLLDYYVSRPKSSTSCHRRRRLLSLAHNLGPGGYW